MEDLKELKHYPTSDEIDSWLDEILLIAQGTDYEVEELGNGFQVQLAVGHVKRMRYLRFKPEGREPFYGYWQPANTSGPAPLLIHTPGGGAEITIHPDLVMQGYNVLEINPLGYNTPSGINREIMTSTQIPPVMVSTIKSNADKGYKEWLIDCTIAVRWAQTQNEVIPQRFSFFGSSQGGMGSMLLGSLFKGKGVRCIASDVPYATNFPFVFKYNLSPAYKLLAFDIIDSLDNPAVGWHAIGYIDWLSHVRRLDIPVLITGGGSDTLCPHEAIMNIFEKLPSTKAYYYMEKQGHDFTNQFINMLYSWFRLYA